MGYLIGIVFVSGGMLTIGWAAYVRVFDDLADPLPAAALLMLLWPILLPALVGLMLRPAKAQGTPTRRVETTGSVGEADGGPVAESDAPKDAPTVEVRP